MLTHRILVKTNESRLQTSTIGVRYLEKGALRLHNLVL